MTLIHDTWATSEQPHGLDMYYSGAWQDITDYLSDDGVTITRKAGDPSEFTCTLDNTGGRFSPRNPNSPLYSLIGRNTPIRYWVVGDDVRLNIIGGGSPSSSAPDCAAFAVTDVDVYFEADMASWATFTPLVGQWGTTNAMWAFYATATGQLGFYYTTDGSTIQAVFSTAVLPFEVARHAVRVTFDSDNGASGHTTTFYYADSIDGPWTQLGDAVVESGTVTLYASTADLAIGDSYAGTRFHGVVHEMRLMDSIGGSAVADPDFTAQTSEAVSFDDDAGNTWTINGSAYLSNRRVRFTGEMAEWPQRWTKKGTCYASIKAAGVTRRLGQGSAPLDSCYRRAITTPSSSWGGVIGYWPMEEDSDATQWGSGLSGGEPMKFAGAPSLGSNTEFVGSDALPVFDYYTTGTGACPAGDDTGEWQVSFLIRPPADGIDTDHLMLRVYTTSDTAHRWEVWLTSAGTIYLRVYDIYNSSAHSSSTYNFAMNGVLCRVALTVQQDGADVDWMVSQITQGANSGGYFNESSGGESPITSATTGRPTTAQIGWGFTDTVFGHLVVQDEIPSTVFFLSQQFDGYVAEEAADRISRLAEEEGTYGVRVGDTSTTLGQQKIATLLDLMAAAAKADLGWMYEPRDALAVAYRSTDSSEAQAPGIQIAYTDNLLLPFEPTEDDAATRNRVTVTRDGGSFATAEDSTSVMSTQPPPDGVGRYDEALTLCLEDDTQPGPLAWWRVHEGTVDEARWPRIGIELAHPTFFDDRDATMNILDLDLGDRLVITDLPDWLPPFDVDQLINGYTERITPTRYKITLSCTPYSPRRAARYEDDDYPGIGVGRYSGEGTVLAEDLTTTETGIDVTAPTGVEWTHDDGDYDVVTSGEVMTVTGISGTAPNYTFTVTRSVNGVVKTHSTDAPIDIAEPCYYVL